jgi:hypothetical protein
MPVTACGNRPAPAPRVAASIAFVVHSAVMG